MSLSRMVAMSAPRTDDLNTQHHESLHKEKASHGLTTVTVDGTSVSSYDDLLALFKAAVAKDAASLKTDNNGNKSVSTSHTTKLKEAVYKKLLQETDSFTSSIFK